MLQYPHRMRLRGPWDCTPLTAVPGQTLPPPRRVVMPCAWAEARLAGRAVRARFTRRFGYPGRIDEHERAAFRRRQRRPNSGVSILPVHRDTCDVAKLMLQRGAVRGMFLVQRQPIDRPRQHPGEPGRPGIKTRGSAKVA